ncbi:MAG: hypothetical protein HY689_15720, partial [Chloroflexi bacterium]|nr:hypothetical protein [Chloroflexota bacterium]
MTRPNPQAPQGVASTWSRWARALVSRCRRTLLAAWRVGATRPRPGEGMDPAPCPVADAAILTPTASTLSPVSPAAGLHDRPRRPASLASVLHAVSPVAVATVVAGGLLWMTPVLSDGRPHAARLAPAVAATPDAIRYAATLTGDLAEPLAVAVGPTGMVYV